MGKNDRVLIGILFLIVVAVVIIVTSVLNAPIVADDSDTTALEARVTELESQVQSLQSDVDNANTRYSTCQSDLTECQSTTPTARECRNRALDFNGICVKLDKGTLLRLDSDQETEIVFRCIDETETTYLYFSRTVDENTINILDASYDVVLEVTDCQI